MSKLACICGYTIADNSMGLTYKAALLRDKDNEEFFNWLTDEIQSYVLSAQEGKVREWIIEKGFGEEYAALGLDHGNVMHDHIHTHYLGKKRDVYECAKCGRLHVEHLENRFFSYAPDSGANNRALDTDQ